MKILFQDEYFAAVDKPAGMLVHRTRLAQAREFALQTLRDQIGRLVFPIHRLDRAASGILIFGLTSEAATAGCELFKRREIAKTYWAVVRGYTDPEGVIDHPILGQPARSSYRRLSTLELPVPMGRHATSRYSLVEISPETGRRHQIRRHLSHLSHPLIGDTTYGEGRHNRLFRDRFSISRLLLMARSLAFVHPFTNEKILIEAGPDSDWQRILVEFDYRSNSLRTSTSSQMSS